MAHLESCCEGWESEGLYIVFDTHERIMLETKRRGILANRLPLRTYTENPQPALDVGSRHRAFLATQSIACGLRLPISPTGRGI